jgi:hypothetical protein
VGDGARWSSGKAADDEDEDDIMIRSPSKTEM